MRFSNENISMPLLYENGVVPMGPKRESALISVNTTRMQANSPSKNTVDYKILFKLLPITFDRDQKVIRSIVNGA